MNETVIRMEVNLPDFDRQIEERFKPALRAAIEQVTCEFIAEIAAATTVAEVEGGE
jgi:hypothetical protein